MALAFRPPATVARWWLTLTASSCTPFLWRSWSLAQISEASFKGASRHLPCRRTKSSVTACVSLDVGGAPVSTVSSLLTAVRMAGVGPAVAVVVVDVELAAVLVAVVLVVVEPAGAGRGRRCRWWAIGRAAAVCAAVEEVASAGCSTVPVALELVALVALPHPASRAVTAAAAQQRVNVIFIRPPISLRARPRACLVCV